MIARIFSFFTVIFVLAGGNVSVAQTAGPSVAVHAYAREGEGELAVQIERIIRNDLGRSGRFTLVDAPDGALTSISALPNFDAASSARYGVIVELALTRDGRLQILVRNWDLAEHREVSGLSYWSTPNNMRRIAHKIADGVAASAGGAAELDSRIVAVGADTRVLLIDSDGANPFFLTTRSADAAASPVFGMSGRSVTYLQGAQLQTLTLDTNRRAPLAASDVVVDAGISAARSGSVVAYVAGADEPNVVLFDQRTSTRTVIDVAGPQLDPSLAPDGASVAFLSGVEGARSVMITTAEGAPRVAISAGPFLHLALSPDVRQVALVRTSAGGEELCLASLDGSAAPRVLTSAPHIGRPSWSPNGTMLLFATGEGDLNVVDIATARRSRIATPVPVTQPSWSGLLD